VGARPTSFNGRGRPLPRRGAARCASAQRRSQHFVRFRAPLTSNVGPTARTANGRSAHLEESGSKRCSLRSQPQRFCSLAFLISATRSRAGSLYGSIDCERAVSSSPCVSTISSRSIPCRSATSASANPTFRVGSTSTSWMAPTHSRHRSARRPQPANVVEDRSD